MASPHPAFREHPYQIEFPESNTILVEDGWIRGVGQVENLPVQDDATHIDLKGKGVTPGLVDFHSHPVFAATREDEFELRTKGASYTEIAAAGGGILNSVQKVRAADEADLATRARPYLDNALALGTTTLEAKSGYGLAPDAEYKMLRVIQSLQQSHRLDLVPTFLGAHEFPAEYKEDHEAYIRLLTETMIPYVAGEKLAVACDIFCETGVFSVDEARQVLIAAKKHGLAVKVHADQLSPLGGSKLAAEIKALSADHIEFIDQEAIEAMKRSGVVAGLLPVAAHFLRMKEDPPVRSMIEQELICALATDFNPGSAMCESMQMAMHLAVIRFRVTAEEALWMATAGSSLALGLDDRGWLGEGALADFVAWNTPNLGTIPYHFGVNHAAIVVKRGKIAAKDGQVLR